jgi:hypothetical protein
MEEVQLDVRMGFEQLLDCLRAVTKAHRLHAQLLNGCTVRLNPAESPLSLDTTANVDHPRNGTFTTILAQYLGDVFLSSCLMTHSNGLTNIVEGGPSLHQWVNHIKAMGAGVLESRTCITCLCIFSVAYCEHIRFNWSICGNLDWCPTVQQWISLAGSDM